MPADHTRLAEHARARHHQALTRAEHALTELADTATAITVASVAKHAQVSRSWIYTQPALIERIQQLKNHLRTTQDTRTTVTRASDDSLRQRLALAHDRIDHLRTENQQLRDALAHAHGQLRTTRTEAPGPLAEDTCP